MRHSYVFLPAALLMVYGAPLQSSNRLAKFMPNTEEAYMRSCLKRCAYWRERCLYNAPKSKESTSACWSLYHIAANSVCVPPKTPSAALERLQRMASSGEKTQAETKPQ